MRNDGIVSKESKHLTCEKEKDEDHNHRVAEVEDGASSSDNLQLREEVVHAVDKQVHRSEATGQEGTPPPVVILNTGYKMLTSTVAKWKICSACHQETIEANNFILEYVWGKTMKYLCAQVEVAEQNCCLRAGNDQNNENQKQESKHVVHLVGPAIQKDNR